MLCLGVCTYRGGAEWEISGQREAAFPGRGVDRNREFSYSELDSSEIKLYSLLLKLTGANKPCFLG